MSVKQFIPNFITLLNMFCGCIAVVFAGHNNFSVTVFFVFLGIFFDFFDGLLARKLEVQSDLGLQLDSLADMITSGLVPGIIMFKLISQVSDPSEFLAHSKQWNSFLQNGFKLVPIALIGFLITLASGYRLAKFNIDVDQQTYFKGLPTPANTLLILSLPLILEFQNSVFISGIILNKWFLISLTLVSCFLLNSGIKLFALKFKDYSFKGNVIRYIFILLSMVLLMVLKFIAIPLIIGLYILLSLLNKKY